MKKHDTIFATMTAGKKNRLRLSKCDTGSTAGVSGKEEAQERLRQTAAELDTLQYKLYAEGKTGVLVVFQAMDTGGKDGVIRSVFSPLNPQGVQVASFKRPTPNELAHDYLWRIHAHVPAKGMIQIFNRSHYEEVLVHRVYSLVSKKELENRYRQINDFERYLTENGVVILKFFLHISKDEQKRRLQARLDTPKKRWKFEPNDLTERKQWDKYQEAYQAAVDKCSPEWAPWRVIPSDHKWYRDWAAAEILLREMKKIHPKFPKEHEGLDGLTVE